MATRHKWLHQQGYSECSKCGNIKKNIYDNDRKPRMRRVYADSEDDIKLGNTRDSAGECR